MGYDKIIWLDSSISLAKCPLKLLEQSNKGVMCFHNLGHELRDYTGAECLYLLGADDNAKINCDGVQVWGGCIGFDFTKQICLEIFDNIVQSSINGCFNDSRTNPKHRHDQATMSVLFHYFGVLPYNYGHIVTNVHAKEPFEYGNYYTFVYGKN